MLPNITLYITPHLILTIPVEEAEQMSLILYVHCGAIPFPPLSTDVAIFLGRTASTYRSWDCSFPALLMKSSQTGQLPCNRTKPSISKSRCDRHLIQTITQHPVPMTQEQSVYALFPAVWPTAPVIYKCIGLGMGLECAQSCNRVNTTDTSWTHWAESNTYSDASFFESIDGGSKFKMCRIFKALP